MAGAADSILAAIPPADCYVTLQTHKQSSGCFRHTYILWTNGVIAFSTVLLLLLLFLLPLIFSPFSIFLLTLQSVLLYLCLLTIFLFSSSYVTSSSYVSPSIYFSSSSRFLLLVYHFSFSVFFLFIVRFPNSCFLPTYCQIPTSLPLYPSHFILIFFFPRTFATVNFGCIYPYATLNLRLWWRYHWHCLCHIFLFGGSLPFRHYSRRNEVTLHPCLSSFN